MTELEPLGPVAEALETALASVKPLAVQDAALRALARRYACDIDEAPCVALDAQKVVEDLMRHYQGPVDPALLDRLRRVLTRIEQTTVLTALGPKLNAALNDLGMTPKARQTVGRTPPEAQSKAPGGVKPGEDDFSRIRRERAAARQHNT